MERRLYRFIMSPAMMVAWLVGIVLAFQAQSFAAGWFHAKLVLVLAMTFMHGLFGHWVTAFARDRNRHSQKFYRIANEIPTVLLILIVILAVVKPF